MKKTAIITPFVFMLIIAILAGCGGSEGMNSSLSLNKGKISFSVNWPDMDVYKTSKLLTPDVKYIKIDIYDSNNNPVRSEWIARDPNVPLGKSFLYTAGRNIYD